MGHRVGPGHFTGQKHFHGSIQACVFSSEFKHTTAKDTRVAAHVGCNRCAQRTVAFSVAKHPARFNEKVNRLVWVKSHDGMVAARLTNCMEKITPVGGSRSDRPYPSHRESESSAPTQCARSSLNPCGEKFDSSKYSTVFE